MSKLTIRLPAGHPLWEYQAGDRSARARELIDNGMQSSNMIAMLHKIYGLISDIDRRMRLLEDMVKNGEGIVQEKEESKEEEDFFTATVDNFSLADFTKI